jgi:hypothetical protein
MKLLSLSILFFLLLTRVTHGAFDHSLYDNILKDHVSNGSVNYAALQTDKRLDDYLSLIAKADEKALNSSNENVAFWSNAYNAYTLKLVSESYPIHSIMDIKKKGFDSPWNIPFAIVAGKNYTLNQIENDVIRRRWPDPRIHYALVCAARSCPQLRSEAYQADRLDAQLEDQGRWFLEHRNSFDFRTKTAELSKVYEWYATDFGHSIQDTLRSIAAHADEVLAKDLLKNAKAWNVSFAEWDWSLNVKK